MPDTKTETEVRQDGPRQAGMSSQQAFARRALVAIALAAGIIAGLLLLWYTVDVLLLVFAGLLVAVFLHGLSGWLSKQTGLSGGWALVAVLLTLLAIVSLGTWLLAPSVASQVAQLTQKLPQAIGQLKLRLQSYGWGQQLLAQMPQPNALVSGRGSIFGKITGIFSLTFGLLTNVVIILFVGLYFASEPGLYIGGLLLLVPRRRRPRAHDVLTTLGYTLRWWLIGRLSVMAVNGTLTAVGLWFLGIPLPWTLGLLTGLLNFIPNLGPILAGVPAVLLALLQGPREVIYVVVLYLIIQNLDGFVFTPLVQKRTVSLPPVLIITSQVFLGVLLGTLGVLLATPLAAVVVVLVKMLYLEDVLGESIDVPGEPAG